MTNEQLDQMEAELAVKLPEDYRQWALGLPPVSDDLDSWHLFFNDPDYLIEINRELREEGCYDEAWSHHLFAIAQADGNYYFMNLADPNSPIYYTNHDCGPYYEADNFEECQHEDRAVFFAI